MNNCAKNITFFTLIFEKCLFFINNLIYNLRKLTKKRFFLTLVDFLIHSI